MFSRCSNTASISTHAPAGGATNSPRAGGREDRDFYSRPCGRGDFKRDVATLVVGLISTHAPAGGATRCRYIGLAVPRHFYSRPCGRGDVIFLPVAAVTSISTHAPAGGATSQAETYRRQIQISTHAPAGGATKSRMLSLPSASNFYSRPCGRGDCHHRRRQNDRPISTHAPAGGATAIFHKSVMRFCGKLPKDDTVLCLASFGFPRRDPKAVYLA